MSVFSHLVRPEEEHGLQLRSRIVAPRFFPHRTSLFLRIALFSFKSKVRARVYPRRQCFTRSTLTIISLVRTRSRGRDFIRCNNSALPVSLSSFFSSHTWMPHGGSTFWFLFQRSCGRKFPSGISDYDAPSLIKKKKETAGSIRNSLLPSNVITWEPQIPI